MNQIKQERLFYISKHGEGELKKRVEIKTYFLRTSRCLEMRSETHFLWYTSVEINTKEKAEK